MSKEIKDSLDVRLNQLIKDLVVDASFFIQHPVVFQVAKRCKFDYQLDKDLIRQAFETEYGFEIL